MLRPTRLQPFDDELFGSAISFGHQIDVAFVLDGHALAK